MWSSEARAAADAALASLDRIIAGKPSKADHDFAEATEHLAACRDQVIKVHRAHGATAAEAKRLGRLNAVISVILGAHFPLASIPWAHVEQARSEMAALLRESAAA